MISLFKGNCLDVMPTLPDHSVDMVLCDLPYGTTASKWDNVIPFEPLWAEYKRLLKGNGAVVLFGAEPFSSMLRLSNMDWFKYDWIWVKNNAVGFVNAKLKPMNRHEVISVFSPGKTANCNSNNMPYNPQGLVKLSEPKLTRARISEGVEKTYCRPNMAKGTHYQEYTNYPTTVLEFAKPSKPVHPTQKPVELLEYLIRTYTKEGDVVLDNTMGSGSTGVAAVHTGRSFIGIEMTDNYFRTASERINGAMCIESPSKNDEPSLFGDDYS